MSNHAATWMEKDKKIIRRAYTFLIFLMALTGFAQMPIFKRYYIADIPGLGWLADFYLTHTMHYIGASLLFALMTYCITIYFTTIRHTYRPTFPAYLRIALLGAIAVTGILRVLKNLPDITFSPDFTLFIDISHLTFMMMLLIGSLVFLIFKRSWLMIRKG